MFKNYRIGVLGYPEEIDQTLTSACAKLTSSNARDTPFKSYESDRQVKTRNCGIGCLMIAEVYVETWEFLAFVDKMDKVNKVDMVDMVNRVDKVDRGQGGMVDLVDIWKEWTR